MHKHLRTAFFLILSSLTTLGHAETIIEKKASLELGESDLDRESQLKLQATNTQLLNLQNELATLYKQAYDLVKKGAKDESFVELHKKIKSLQESVKLIQINWKDQVAKTEKQEPYSLWHQPETTLGQLVIDYGSCDYVYLMPQDMSNMPINISSQMPVPREAWSELLELIIAQKGIAVRQLNPYLRELYYSNSDALGFALVTDKKRDLELLSPLARVCYMHKTDSADPVKVMQALSRFASPDRVQIHQFGKTLVFIGNAKEISEIVKVHDFLGSDALNREYKLVVLSKIEGREMELILQSYFQNEVEKGNSSAFPSLAAEIKILSLPTNKQALFLCGTKEQLAKADKIIEEVTQELQNPQEKSVYWYTCQHTEAEELAKTLQKVYQLMVTAPNLEGIDNKVCDKKTENITVDAPDITFGLPPQGPLPISPPVNSPLDKLEKDSFKDSFGNFVVDMKSSSIIMVVEKELLPRMKELIKKLDQPTRMVQVEVLLFEKRFSDKNSFGLNLLRIGSQASNTNSKGLAWNWNTISGGYVKDGILKFLFSHDRHGKVAPFDLAYNFLLTQEDVHINACPSFVTNNHAPATINIADEISINTGAYPIGTDVRNIENAYSRAQYGIFITITPTINLPGEDADGDDDETGYVTLDTDIHFDTIKPSANPDRPDVLRRAIKNLVRIPDGQTVILGGLKRKTSQDSEEKIPFLGDIPGVGKLFGNSTLYEHQSEMFIFITPKIIYNACEDLCRIRYEELRKRPGDTPEFMYCLRNALESQRQRSLQGGIKMLFGPSDSSCR
ncbi:MAG: hypothetical protein JHC93_01455 [Parachlamydiales bacterium]|nr:hypothetical protein [Parachlamydiales bacterium]